MLLLWRHVSRKMASGFQSYDFWKFVENTISKILCYKSSVIMILPIYMCYDCKKGKKLMEIAKNEVFRRWPI